VGGRLGLPSSVTSGRPAAHRPAPLTKSGGGSCCVRARSCPARKRLSVPELRDQQFQISLVRVLHTGEGWLYLAVVRDGHSRRVLGWAMDERQDAGLVDRALRMAHTLRGTVPDGLVFHADRGVQFTSQMLFETCEELGVLQSMGRTGVCWDNAMAESFWATLKTEFYDRRSWPTRAEARREVARWIGIVYNRRRLHSSLDYTSPVAFEKAIEHGQVETEEHTDQAQAA